MSLLIVCLDFDGTLVDSQGRIHPSDVVILAAHHEHRGTFIPATGRPLHSVRHAFERNGVFVDQPVPLPLVLQNGAALYTPGEELLDHHPFDPEVQAALLEAMRQNRGISFFLFTLGRIHVMWPSETASRMEERFDLDTRPFKAESEARRFTKALCIAPTPKALQAFAEEVAGLPLELRYSLETVLEINQRAIDKAYGLRTLLGHMALTDVKIVAAGDGENDIPLLDAAHVSFAPDTSPEAIRTRVDHVIDRREGGMLKPMLDMIG
jgi:Cof subfamily protein (haloacid dehalogenase superfamily)